MVGDMTEVTQLLCKAVEQNINKNEKKDNESVKTDIKSCDADAIDKSALNKTIQSYVKNDRHENEDIISKETSNDASNKDDEYVDDNQDNYLSQSIESSLGSSSVPDSYYHDNCCDDFDESGEDECPSDFDE